MTLTVRPGVPLSGTAAIPGDKSGSHRALIFAAMADGESTLRNVADGADVRATIDALRAFGVAIDAMSEGVWRVRGQPWTSPEAPIACGNSGTSARLLIGAVAGMPGVSAAFAGDPSLSRRPMRRLIDPLRRMGASIDGGDTLPLRVMGSRLGGIEHRNLPASAQVKTALMLAGLGSDKPVRIVEPLPSRDHGEILLERLGVAVSTDDTPDGYVITLGEERTLHAAEIGLGADPSSAAFPLVAALLVPGSAVRVPSMLVNPLRMGLYDTLQAMGANFELSNERLLSGEMVADVEVAHAPLRACHVRADEIPSMIDEIPILAMACAMAEGESVIEGLGELRHKESDRLAALERGLRACGVDATAEDDTLRIVGRGSVDGGEVESDDDHRIAMAFLVLGLASERGIRVDGDEMIATSFPDYVDVMRSLGAILE